MVVEAPAVPVSLCCSLLAMLETGVSPLGCREVALAQSVCQGSCASLGSCLASPGGVGDCWHCVGSSPAAPAALLRAGWDRGIDLPSVVARMKWSILLLCGCPLGWAPPCAQLALLGVAGPGALFSPALALSFRMPSLSPSPGQGYRDGSCDMEWQLGPGPETQKSAPSPAGINCTGCGGDRQVLAMVSRLLTLSLPRAEGRGAAAMGLDMCGLHRLSRPGREWLSLFFPDTELLAKLGTFQSALLSLGFPPGCWSERKQVRRQRRAGQLGPALCLSCPCSRVAHGKRWGSGGGVWAWAPRRICHGHIWERPW